MAHPIYQNNFKAFVTPKEDASVKVIYTWVQIMPLFWEKSQIETDTNKNVKQLARWVKGAKKISWTV